MPVMPACPTGVLDQMTVIPQFRPVPRTVGFFVYPGFQILDAAGPIAAFEVADTALSGSYRTMIVSLEGGPIRSSCGVTLETVAMRDAARFDTLIVVGGAGSLAATKNNAVIEHLRGLKGQVRRLCSVCSGAFLLASVGLLDGRRATTHWH